MPRVRVHEDANLVGGSGHWNDLQTKALCMAWYHVSANPAGKGTSQTRDCGKDPLKMPTKRSRERWLKICQVYIIQVLSWIG